MSNRNKSTFIRGEMVKQNRNRNRKKKNTTGKPSRAKLSLPLVTDEFKNKYNEGHPYRKGFDLLTSARLLFHLTTQNVLKTRNTAAILNPYSGVKNLLSKCSTITKN
jgi:hypothetical protein